MQIIAGAKGDGKSTIACSIAATISTGGLWPDGTRADKGNVLMWSGEDGVDDTLIPRLMAMGADLSRIFIMSTVTDENGRKRPFDPAEDLADIEAMAEGVPGGKIDFLSIDPVVSAVKSGANSHNNAETRQGLQHVVDFVEKHGCAMLGVHHLTKGTKGNAPVERLTGSLAFGAIPRIVLMTATKQDDEEDGPPRVLVRAASNIGPSGGAFGYDAKITSVHNKEGVEVPTSRIEWGKFISGAAKALIDAAEAEKKSDENSPALREAKMFLIELLRDGPVPAADVQSAAKAAITTATLRRVKEEMGIKPRKNGKIWEWSLPGDASRHFEEPESE